MSTTTPVVSTFFYSCAMDDKKLSDTPTFGQPPYNFPKSSSFDEDTTETSSWSSTSLTDHLTLDFCSLDASPTLSERSKKFDALSIDVINTASDAVGHLLAHMLTMLKEPPCPRMPFDASWEPKMSIVEYYQRVRQYSQATPESIVCSLVVLRKVVRATPRIYLTNYNVHRLLITSIMVFAKFYDDGAVFFVFFHLPFQNLIPICSVFAPSLYFFSLFAHIMLWSCVCVCVLVQRWTRMFVGLALLESKSSRSTISKWNF
jgi:hypothetical protein